MRQFDVLVWGNDISETPHTPYLTDKALGWFFDNDLNASLLKSDAEWIIFAHESVHIDRDFLNSLAECISGYPMVDAFAPRIKISEAKEFVSGFRLDKHKGIAMLDENAKMRFVALPHPYIAAFSRRIIQRTGALDTSMPTEFQIADLSLRMLHAGGKMFSIPYLVAMVKQSNTLEKAPLQGPSELAYTLTKAFGVFKNLPYLARHPKGAYFVWKTRKELFEKRDKATLLSKFKKSDLAELL